MVDEPLAAPTDVLASGETRLFKLHQRPNRNNRFLRNFSYAWSGLVCHPTPLPMQRKRSQVRELTTAQLRDNHSINHMRGRPPYRQLLEVCMIRQEVGDIRGNRLFTSLRTRILRSRSGWHSLKDAPKDSQSLDHPISSSLSGAERMDDSESGLMLRNRHRNFRRRGNDGEPMEDFSQSTLNPV